MTIDGLKDVYSSPDLSLEERRRKTMDRLLKLRTEEGKEVRIIMVYCLLRELKCLPWSVAIFNER